MFRIRGSDREVNQENIPPPEDGIQRRSQRAWWWTVEKERKAGVHRGKEKGKNYHRKKKQSITKKFLQAEQVPKGLSQGTGAAGSMINGERSGYENYGKTEEKDHEKGHRSRKDEKRGRDNGALTQLRSSSDRERKGRVRAGRDSWERATAQQGL